MRLYQSHALVAVAAVGRCGYIIKGLPRCQGKRAEGSRYCAKHKAMHDRQEALIKDLAQHRKEVLKLWPQPPYTQIYFIRVGSDGPVKVGKTDDVTKRLAALQTANPYKLVLLAAFIAPPEIELQLHSGLAEHRLEGEWFRWCPELELLVAFAREGELASIKAFADQAPRPSNTGFFVSRGT